MTPDPGKCPNPLVGRSLPGSGASVRRSACLAGRSWPAGVRPGCWLLARDGRSGPWRWVQPGGGDGSGATVFVLADQVDDGVDQGQVGESLREVPEVQRGAGVVLRGLIHARDDI